MPTYNDYGIILSTNTLSEADKILNIYTKENGLVRAVAKGIKKTSSKFSGKLDQLSCCHFQFVKGKNLDLISECNQLNSFAKLRSDLIRLSYGILFLDVVSNFAHEKESESSYIYELLCSGLKELEETQNTDLVAIEFILNFLATHGFSPQLENCVSCSKETKNDIGSYKYSCILGGILCSGCAKNIPHKVINEGVYRLLQSHHDYKKEDVIETLNLLREHLDLRAKKRIKTFDLVFSL